MQALGYIVLIVSLLDAVAHGELVRCGKPLRCAEARCSKCGAVNEDRAASLGYVIVGKTLIEEF